MQEGLTTKEAESLLSQYGKNELKEANKVSIIKIFFRQIKNNFVIYLLFLSMTASFFVGKSVTAYVILAVIIVIITTGIVQEYRAEEAIASLKKMISPVSIVIRDKIQQEVPSTDLVPGDILLLRTGEKIPADCQVIESYELIVNESALTGESLDISKSPRKNENLIYMGTFVTGGRCTAKVVSTAMNTKFGKIADLISKEEKELPLQNKVNLISKYVAAVAITMAILTTLVMFFRADVRNMDTVVELLIVAIAISVSSFPEGFPVTLLTTLSSGTYRMAKKNAIVNRMSIIETLGETTVICSDKTGTITKGEMTAKKLFYDDSLIDITGSGYEANGEFKSGETKINPLKDEVLNLLLKSSVVCNDASISRTGEDNHYYILGNPTEASLLIMAAKARIHKEDLKSIRKEEIPFNSQRKLMSVLCSLDNQNLVFTKGAPEILIEKCSQVQRNNGIFNLRKADKDRILEKNKQFTSQAYRTIALAYKKAKSSSKNDFENDLIFLGIVAIEDAPRPEVKLAIATCKESGIKVKMITGDNKDTAISIARQIGLEVSVITGDEIDKVDDEKLKDLVNKISIFARVKPEHKLRIVNALKSNGEIVTMTGDGINDAPALKAAHIGVAMGKSGTDVSREVADLTLKDDNFATIIEAISEGRTIFNNMRKFITYQLSCNFAELAIIFCAILIGLPLPLVAIQILFMNLVTSDIPAITLGLNPHSNDIMSSPPRKKSNLVTKESFGLIALAGIIMAVFTLGTFYLSLNYFNQSLDTSRTLALVTLIIFEIANAFNFRSFRKPVLTRSPFVNSYLVSASIISIILTIIVIYTPLSNFFYTVPISLNAWLVIIAVSLSVIIAFDILKALNKRLNLYNEQF